MSTTDLRATIRADLEANRRSPKGKVAVVAFRLAHAAGGSGRRRWWAVPVLAFYRLIVDWVMGIEIPAGVHAGPGLAVFHGTGLVVHSGTRIGAGVTLRQGTTIGARGHGDGPDGQAPVLGNDVDVGVGALVIGPWTVGDGAVIGAGAVVVGDVPAGATVVGNPARILSESPTSTSASRGGGR
ncbi:MAG: serine O-acetyltransferase [Actinomycetota bacterium]